ncbi:hypothetical protein M0805_005667 [Coniferiporia weirii]|nr:hypothetical protein M0805_005667 [Coniferiporia weirii]
MAIKRKFDAELDDASAHYQSAKQLKLVPFPTSDSYADMDIAMSDSALMDIDPVYAAFHSRLPSSASSDYSSDASLSEYPMFDIYPASYPPSRASPPVGMQQFSTLDFAHKRNDCKQIPKLRIACGAGPSGQRSMWAMCEECGAIEIVDS